MGTSTVPEPTLGRALGAIADTAVDQARDLAVAHLDRWAGQLHDRLVVPSAQPETVNARDLHPAIVGALIGASVAWLLARRRVES